VRELGPIRYARMAASPFGFFASPERNLVFDINDFDETVPGPWEWDVKRLCASLHVIARPTRVVARRLRRRGRGRGAHLSRAGRRVCIVDHP
jgi:Uncharacterized protein conserved in bacteria (DUF2252)